MAAGATSCSAFSDGEEFSVKILHASPSYYSAESVIGGGEKYIIYMIRALIEGAKEANASIENTLLAFGDRLQSHTLAGGVNCEIIVGTPGNPSGISLIDLLQKFENSDIVVVHQCLTVFGMFIASHARLAGKTVVGIDHGGGEHPLIYHTKEVSRVFDMYMAQSEFAASSFRDLGVPIRTILGPVDTEYYAPDPSLVRKRNCVVAVGRLLPHKGFDRIIKALPMPFELIIAGTRSDEAYFDHLHSLVDESSCKIVIKEGLSDDEILGLLRTASIFVHASTHFDYRGAYYAKPELLGLAPLEALACGTTTFVSTAGSLGELAKITGCHAFGTEKELAELFESYAAAELDTPTPDQIHASLESMYGIRQFGSRLFDELNIFRRNNENTDSQ